MSQNHLGFHFTHLNNLKQVIAMGAMLCDTTVTARGLLVVETADSSLKQQRRETPVPVGPMGCLADYVPFYFSPHSPMLLRVATGQNVDYSGGQDPLVFLVVESNRLIATGHEMVVSDGHPVAGLSRFADVSLIDTHVDWSIMRGRMFTNTDEDGDRQRRRQAELLVHSQVPLDHVSAMLCRTPRTKTAVEALLLRAGLDIPTDVRPLTYYPNKP